MDRLTMDVRERIAAALAAEEAHEVGGDDVRASTLRLVQCAVRDRDIAARQADRCQGCGEAEIIEIIEKMIAQREDSVTAYENDGRPDMAERERQEIVILREFLPPPMSDEEIRAAARLVVDELEARGFKDLGRCMGAIKQRYTGRVDISRAGAIVKEMLS